MSSNPSRRRFIQGLAAGGAVAGLGLWPKQTWALKSPGQPNVLSGTQFDLSIGEMPMNFTGRTRSAVTVNGSLPGPILRWREVDTVTLRVAKLPRKRAFRLSVRDASGHTWKLVLRAKTRS